MNQGEGNDRSMLFAPAGGSKDFKQRMIRRGFLESHKLRRNPRTDTAH